MAKDTDEFIRENVPRGTSSPKIRGVSSLKGYGEGEGAADIRRSAREALKGLVGLEPFDPTNPSEAYRIASTPTPLVAIGAGIRGAKKVIGSEEAAKAIGKAAEAAGMKAPTTAAKSLTTLDDFHLSLGDAIRKRSADMQDLIESTPFKYSVGDRVFTADSARKNRPPLEILNRVMVGNDPMREGHPILGKVIKDPETGKTKRTPYEPGYEVLVFEDKDNWSKFRIPESAIKGMIDPIDPLEKQEGGDATVEEFIKKNVSRGTSPPETRGVSSLKGYGEGGEETEMIRKSAREVLRALVGVKPYDETNPTEAYRMASTPTPLAALGIFGRRGLGIIDAAKASKAFKGKGLDVAEPERFLVKELMDRLKEQGIDVDRTWLRGKKDPELGFQYSPKYEYLEALYEYQKRPDAVERALKGTKTGRPWSQSGTLSRQPGDRKVTKANTKGGVWLTESPTVAESYTGDTGFVIPVLTRKPDVVLDAKGEQWDDFFENSKEFTKAQYDPKVKSIEVRNIIDIGNRGRTSYSGLELNDELRALLTSNNLFLKKPFVDEDVVSKLTGEPFPYQDGGSVNVPRETSTSKQQLDKLAQVSKRKKA